MVEWGVNLITTILLCGMGGPFIWFVCTRCFCPSRLRLASSQMFETESRMDFEMMPEYRISGLDPDEIVAIPTMKYYRESFGIPEDAKCVICLGQYEENEVLRIIPKCGHTFHRTCIDLWLERQSTCPVCRLPVQDSTENEPLPSSTHGSETQYFDSTEISVEHSRSWLLPASEQSEVHRNSEAPENYVTIEVESRSSELGPARS